MYCYNCDGEGHILVLCGYHQYGPGYGDCEQIERMEECEQCGGSGEIEEEEEE